MIPNLVHKCTYYDYYDFFVVLDYGMQRDSMRLLNGLWTQIDDRNILGQVMRLRIVISAKRD